MIGSFTALPPAAPPNDKYWSEQANLGPASSFGIGVLRAWPYSRGAGVVIAVVDSGYVSHPDLSGRVLQGFDFISDPERARDGDGRDSNPRDEGDWVTQAEIDAGGIDPDCEVDSSSWHGTLVASIALATANNSLGIAGIAPAAELLPVRAIGRCGGSNQDIADAIRWAAGGEVSGVPANLNPADVINLSIAGEGPCRPPLSSAIQEAIELGAFVVTAAGNDGFDASRNSPANCEGVITVAAVDQNGRRTEYSDYGDVVAIAAPGGAFPAGIIGASNFGETISSRSGYARGAGTSFAAPHVAGILALARSLDPTTPAPDLAALLQKSATPFPLDPSTGLPWAGDCDEGRCGAGIANAGAMLALMAARPKPTVQFSAPESLSIGLDGGGSAPISATSGVDG
ncbi:MAG: S8 family peptidase, partial [Thermomicrobiales bacterium]